MNALETLYYEWNNTSGRNEKVDSVEKDIDRILDTVRNGGMIARKDFFQLEDLIGDYGSISEKHGFMAGFEVAKQLFLGGSVK